MRELTTIIVDDEPLALDLLRSYLEQHSQINIVAQCKNGKEAISQVVQLQPDLMFLDIQMPGQNGFDVIKSLQADVMPLVVFVTAYEQYALSAFDVNAVDYVLKPIDEESLNRAVKRCIERVQLITGNEGFKPRIIQAIDQIMKRNSSLSEATENSIPAPVEKPVQDQKIVVKDRSAITLVDQDDIDWVDAAGDYMCLHVGGVTHIMRSTLKSLLAQLNPRIFKRVHRSTIVNINRIEKIIPHTKGECFLVLAEDERIKVSRNYRTVIKSLIDEIANRKTPQS